MDHLALTPELEITAWGVGKFRFDLRISLLTKEYLARGCSRLQASRDINRISDDSIIRNRSFADVAHKGFAGGNTRAKLQMISGCQVLHSLHDPNRRFHRSFGVVFSAKRGAEESHNLIAHKFIQSAVVIKNQARSQGIKAVETLCNLSGGKLLGERGEAAHVNEQHGYSANLPARGSQLVSKRAELRVFPRRTDLDEAKRNREQAQEGHETFFTPPARRQVAVEPS